MTNLINTTISLFPGKNEDRVEVEHSKQVANTVELTLFPKNQSGFAVVLTKEEAENVAYWILEFAKQL